MSENDKKRLYFITSPTANLILDGARKGEVVFTVSNPGGASAGRALILPQGDTRPEWMKIENGTEWRFEGTRQVTVGVAVPADVPAGRYGFRLDVVDPDVPDERCTQGPTVGFEVAAAVHPRPFPRWVVPVAAAVLLVIGVLAWVLWPRKTAVATAPAAAPAPATAPAAPPATAPATASTAPADQPAARPRIPLPTPAAGGRAPAVVGRPAADDDADVPNLVGMDWDAAVKVLDKAGLKAKRDEAVTAKAEIDRVLKQDAPAGLQMKRGSTVTLTVETGVRLPAVEGKAVANAIEKLAAAGFDVDTRKGWVAGKTEGAVLDQTPEAGQPVRRKSKVVLTVQDRTVRVPDLKGLARARAEAELKDRGLGVAVRVVDTPNSPLLGVQDRGKVVAQRPAAGTDVRVGTEVALDVGR